MKIFFDDERPLPSDFDILIKSYEEMIRFFEKHHLDISEISFDFYLMGSQWTGQDALEHILKFCRVHNLIVPTIRFHSSDRAARFRMKSILRTYKETKENATQL